MKKGFLSKFTLPPTSTLYYQSLITHIKSIFYLLNTIEITHTN